MVFIFPESPSKSLTFSIFFKILWLSQFFSKFLDFSRMNTLSPDSPTQALCDLSFKYMSPHPPFTHQLNLPLWSRLRKFWQVNETSSKKISSEVLWSPLIKKKYQGVGQLDNFNLTWFQGGCGIEAILAWVKFRGNKEKRSKFWFLWVGSETAQGGQFFPWMIFPALSLTIIPWLFQVFLIIILFLPFWRSYFLHWKLVHKQLRLLFFTQFKNSLIFHFFFLQILWLIPDFSKSSQIPCLFPVFQKLVTLRQHPSHLQSL